MSHNARVDLFKRFVKEQNLNIADEKIKILEDMSYFDAPASTKFHLSYEGGLFEHSVNVAIILNNITKDCSLSWQRDCSPYIIGLFHDICKCDLYLKQPNGTYSYNVDADQRHGLKSVELLKKLIYITDEEAACIEHHMGAFTDKDKWKGYTDAIHKFENVLWTHTADMFASQVFEEKYGNT